MDKYDYCAAVRQDILDYFEENDVGHISKEDREQLYDDMWVDDSVTGNGSGSYTFNAWRAEENLCHNADLVAEAYEEFGGDIHKNAESQDVTIRCYLLGQLLDECVREWNESHPEEVDRGYCATCLFCDGPEAPCEIGKNQGEHDGHCPHWEEGIHE